MKYLCVLSNKIKIQIKVFENGLLPGFKFIYLTIAMETLVDNSFSIVSSFAIYV